MQSQGFHRESVQISLLVTRAPYLRYPDHSPNASYVRDIIDLPTMSEREKSLYVYRGDCSSLAQRLEEDIERNSGVDEEDDEQYKEGKA